MATYAQARERVRMANALLTSPDYSPTALGTQAAQAHLSAAGILALRLGAPERATVLRAIERATLAARAWETKRG